MASDGHRGLGVRRRGRRHFGWASGFAVAGGIAIGCVQEKLLPPVLVDRVEVVVADTVVEVGATRQLSATVLTAFNEVLTDRPVTWGVSPSGILSVSATGLVTALVPGNATVSATAEGRTGSRVLTVRPVPVASVEVTAPSTTLFVAQTLVVSATARSATNQTLAGRSVTWTTSNASVAPVSASGTVSGLTAGTATITAIVEGVVGSLGITVVPTPIATIDVSPSSPTVMVGQTIALTATARSAANAELLGRGFTWSSSNPSIATVSTTGVVSGVAAGAASITASAEGVTGSASVTVTPVAVASVSLTPALDTLQLGETVQMTARTFAASGAELTGRAVGWQSLNPSVATVSASGLVSAVGSGTTTVRATSEGVTANATIVAVSTNGFWETRANMPNPRWGFTIGAISGTIYTVGGFRIDGHLTNVEAYDVATNVWTTRNGSGAVQTGAGSAVIGGLLYAAGGTDCCVVTANMRAYDPATDAWAPRAGLGAGVRADAGAAVIDNVLYLAGGRNASSTVGIHESFNPAAAVNGAWTTRAPMLTARTGTGAAALDGKFYVIGGQSVGGAFSNHVEVYDPLTNAWTTRAAMPTARADHVLLAHNGRLYAIGGTNGTPLAIVEEYSPATNSWRTLAPMPTARAVARGAVVNGKLYVIGGYAGANTALGTVEAFTPP